MGKFRSQGSEKKLTSGEVLCRFSCICNDVSGRRYTTQINFIPQWLRQSCSDSPTPNSSTFQTPLICICCWFCGHRNTQEYNWATRASGNRLFDGIPSLENSLGKPCNKLCLGPRCLPSNWIKLNSNVSSLAVNWLTDCDWSWKSIYADEPARQSILLATIISAHLYIYI